MYRAGDSPAVSVNPAVVKPLKFADSPVNAPPDVLVTFTWRYIARGPEPQGLLLSAGAMGVIAVIATAPGLSAETAGARKAPCRAITRTTASGSARSSQRAGRRGAMARGRGDSDMPTPPSAWCPDSVQPPSSPPPRRRT